MAAPEKDSTNIRKTEIVALENKAASCFGRPAIPLAQPGWKMSGGKILGAMVDK
jgi:CBS-domain-containing membrane protein